MEGAPRSRTAAPLDPGADGRSSDHWYNVLGGTTTGVEPCGTAPGSGHDRDGPCDEAGPKADTTEDRAASALRAARQVADQNAALAGRLAALTEAQARHEEQRDRLEAKIDRLCGLLITGEPDDWQPLDDAISRRVTDSMKPFLLAIIDLLELSMRRAPTPPGASGAPQRSAAGEPLAHLEELPGGLPDILIKPLEELIDPGRSRAGPRAPEDTSRRGPRPTAEPHTAPEGSRAFAWIPVIPETSKR